MRQFIARLRVALAMPAIAVALLLTARLDGQEPFRFRTGIELINVTATVSDSAGGIAPRLTKADFTVYEDDQPVEITHFSAERVPVSLGIILDTSGSMGGEKIVAARAALSRFVFELLGPDDEFFIYRFDNRPHRVTGWTQDRNLVGAELEAMRADGATALFDAVSEALPLLRSGKHRKKALLVISDGNDGASRMELTTLQQLIRESDALVYAIGIDSQKAVTPAAPRSPGGSDLHYQPPDTYFQRRRPPISFPFPMPGRGRPPRTPPVPHAPPVEKPRTPKMPGPDEPSHRGVNVESDRVDAEALHQITDASGGGTEIVRAAEDLGPTTARIAEELSNQYFIGYPSRGYQDGRWHTIRVELRDPALRVRARTGYIGK